MDPADSRKLGIFYFPSNCLSYCISKETAIYSFIQDPLHSGQAILKTIKYAINVINTSILKTKCNKKAVGVS